MRQEGLWSRWSLLLVPLLFIVLALGGCDDGDDGAPGADGADGAPGIPGSALIDASTAPDIILENLDVESEITSVTIASPPVVTFSVKTSQGVPIAGLGALWDESSSFVRFTITKLVPGTAGDPDSWVAYTRDTTNDGSTPPDYDTGSLVDNGDGTYEFTFKTDVTMVSGVSYEPTLTHRVAGQIGSSSVALEPQNLVYDFVPAGGAVTNTRNIAVMDSCNECHDGLVFHGRRFLVEYCVNCHNPDLADGEGNMSFMVHRIHSAGSFEVLDDAIDYSEVTYPQELANCRKCHNGDDVATAQGDNWKNKPNKAACTGCHSTGHPAEQVDNTGCAGCHPATVIEGYHTTANATPNNPSLLEGQREIVYEILGATDTGGTTGIDFRITSDGEPLDLTNLPADFLSRRPGFLFAYALPQGDIDEPADYNNLGRSAGQPLSIAIDGGDSLTCSGGICTATFVDAFPVGATLKTVGLQGYFQQDIDGSTVSLHTKSVVQTVTDNEARRVIVDNEKCAACHEFFEGHGGNRNYDIAICTMCHVPNLSSSGRSINPADAADRDGDPLTVDPSSATVDLGTSDTSTWPEDSNNLKDMIHGIHSSAFRTSDYEFVRGRNDGIYYNWSEVTFPAEVNNCLLCHNDPYQEGRTTVPSTYVLPLNANLLETTVRTTGADDGLDVATGSLEAFEVVGEARDSVPNTTDWVNSPTASTCFYCHDSELAAFHMMQNGGVLSAANPEIQGFEQRGNFEAYETCAVCHAPGKSADLSVVHGIE